MVEAEDADAGKPSTIPCFASQAPRGEAAARLGSAGARCATAAPRVCFSVPQFPLQTFPSPVEQSCRHLEDGGGRTGKPAGK